MGYDVTDFQRQVVERSKQIPVLVDFWAEWCGPCRMLTPVLEKLAQQSDGGWELAKLNTEEYPQIAMQFGIQGIPAVKLFHDGKVIAEFVGALPEYAVAQWLKKFVPSKETAKIEQAEQLWKEGKAGEAQRLLDGIVAGEPDNARAKVLLAKTYLFSNPVKANSIITNIDDPKYFDEVEAIQTLVRLKNLQESPHLLPESPVKLLYLAAIADTAAQRFDQALGKFIDVIRNDRYYDDDGSRKAVVAIFKYLGEEHPTTQHHRRDFSSALYV